jgi:transcriptional regulator with XRE-family HTH domain
MKERVLEFLKAENKSSAQLAEEIGVQPSGISHILSGRNNPSLDFAIKMLEKYQFISTDWLLFGKGSMYKETKMQTLFDEGSAINIEMDKGKIINEYETSDIEFQELRNNEKSRKIAAPHQNQPSSVRKIVWFFENNSFEEYFPRNRS